MIVRAFDIVFALTLLLVTAPVLVLLGLLVKYSSPGPVFFVQPRVGRDGELFPCFKFRTMVVDASSQIERLLAACPIARREWEQDQKLRNDPRIIPFGFILRKFSLDELPQLINILMGQMSVVGPRPIIESEVYRYGRRFAEYCSVKPGLTGLWQVSGRNETTYDQRVSLDAYYARNKSLLLDLKIILQTVPVVLGARGAF